MTVMDLLLALDLAGARLVQRPDGGLRVVGGHLSDVLLAALRQHKEALLTYLVEGRPLTRHDARVRLLVLCTALDLDDAPVRALPEPDIAACLGLPDDVLTWYVKELDALAREA
jgi:hypothetical protein